MRYFDRIRITKDDDGGADIAALNSEGIGIGIVGVVHRELEVVNDLTIWVFVALMIDETTGTVMTEGGTLNEIARDNNYDNLKRTVRDILTKGDRT